MNDKIMTVIFVAVIFFISFLLFQKSQPKIVNFTTLTSEKLFTMLSQKYFFFVNVHIPYEGEIKNTDAFIPYDRIADNLEKLPKDKDAKIVLYCKSGRMSEIVARELTQLGYMQITHLSGGMIDWKKNGYEIVKN